jgi:hypothetical protein
MPEIGALRRCVLERELRFPHIETCRSREICPCRVVSEICVGGKL